MRECILIDPPLSMMSVKNNSKDEEKSLRGRPIIGADIKHFADYRYRPF